MTSSSAEEMLPLGLALRIAAAELHVKNHDFKFFVPLSFTTRTTEVIVAIAEKAEWYARCTLTTFRYKISDNFGLQHKQTRRSAIKYVYNFLNRVIGMIMSSVCTMSVCLSVCLCV